MVVLFLLILLISTNSHAINIDDLDSNSNLQILPKNHILIHNDKYYFGIKITLNNGWKTYWKNPGDAGSSIKIEFDNKQNILDHRILYPFPSSYLDHGVRTIGYENEIVFPIELKIKDANKKIVTDINIEYLICKEICIPKNVKRKINFSLKKKNNNEDSLIFEYLEKVPKDNQGIFKFNDIVGKEKNTFYAVLDNPKKKEIEIYPFSSEVNLFLKSIVLEKKTKIFFETEESVENLKEPIELVISDGTNFEKIFLDLKDLRFEPNILRFLFLALIGGFILNFMPCVFPVLSIKVMSMMELNKYESLKIKKLSFIIILGIIFSFIILALTLISFKSLGISVGWGFQFQNIYFLIFLSLIILLFSLNLLGFFEIILPNSFINYMGRLERQDSNRGYFLSGMFATLMATPCSAPFLGTAIGFASLTSNLNIFLIFIFISFGFSIPYFFLILKPSLLHSLPKPGKWMISFKYFLGIILLLTFFWLLSVMKVSVLLNLSLFISVLFFSIYLKKKERENFLTLTFSLIICLLFFFVYFNKKDSLTWEKFDENLIKTYSDQNNLIFVDFTADWCVTCKFNKFTTLENEDVIDYFLKNNVKLLRGDWTKKDEEILNFIKKYERFGVPVNIIYSDNMREGLVLPEILSKSIIIDNFERIKDK